MTVKQQILYALWVLLIIVSGVMAVEYTSEPGKSLYVGCAWGFGFGASFCGLITHLLFPKSRDK